MTDRCFEVEWLPEEDFNSWLPMDNTLPLKFNGLYVTFHKSDSPPGQTLHSDSCGSSLERTVHLASEHPPSQENKRHRENSTPNLQPPLDASDNKTSPANPSNTHNNPIPIDSSRGSS
ncbi:hypothetical protein PCANC_26642 [Puccinia coronata f. sp. avenae]|uniref:Uncharacterized protein n=1 Tax=Puccinia coronata f. sp. avenae TaxID=200324 RepID=A0A2N5RXP9_9BASI|nr:hypothetical protein PCANC_26642 [Puccinia coronata f. sp. avenae]